MKNYKKEFNYILYYIDWQSDPKFIAQLFWPYKIHIYFRHLSPL